jgi:flagellar assembly protein FliH
MAGLVRKDQVALARRFSLADLEAEGRQILARATAEAQQIVQRGQADARQLREQERQAGYQSGLAEGRAAGLEQVRQETRESAVAQAREQAALLVAALQAGLTEFEQGKRNLIAAAESGLIELAVAIARRVCKREAGRATDAARENVRNLLEMVQHGQDVELHLHPAECELLRGADPEWLAQVERLQHAKFIPDDSVTRGGCILRARATEIDARLETQLDRIAAALGVSADGAVPGLAAGNRGPA